MNLIIPFESKVKFDGKVSEICSISLEHEETINENEVLGNFLITGTYKEYDLSINTIDFNFTVPYSVEIEKNIDRQSIEISIDNFTYDIKENEMTIKIDYVVNANEKEESIDPLDLIEDNDFDNLRKELEEPIKEKIDIINDTPDETQSLNIEKTIESEAIKRQIESINEINNLVIPDEDYITFHVHFVKESETFESISLMYKVSIDDIKLLNHKEQISIGDKLLIPVENE